MSSFYRKQTYLNAHAREQEWISNVECSHNLWCSCTNWLAHFLDTTFPPDSSNRQRTIEQLLNQAHKQIRALPALPLKPWFGSGEGDAAGPGDAEHTENETGAGDTAADPGIPEEELLNILQQTEDEEKENAG